MRRLEGRFDDPVELEERLDRRLVEVVPRLAYPLGVVAPVPGLDGDVVAVRLGLGLEVVALRGGAGEGRRPDFVEEPEHVLGRLGHGVVELEVREGLVAEKPGALRPEAHHLGDDGLVVGRAASVAAARPGAEGLLAQVAAAREGEERLDARSGERDHVLAGKPPLLGRRSGGLAQEERQPGEIRFAVEDEDVGFLVGQHVLGELRAEAREPLGDGRETRLRVRREARTGPDEDRVIAVEQAPPVPARARWPPGGHAAHRRGGTGPRS